MKKQKLLNLKQLAFEVTKVVFEKIFQPDKVFPSRGKNVMNHMRQCRIQLMVVFGISLKSNIHKSNRHFYSM